MPQKPIVPRKRGASRMFQLGYKCAQIWLDDVELSMVKAAFPHLSLAKAAKHYLLEACRQNGEERWRHVKKVADEKKRK